MQYKDATILLGLMAMLATPVSAQNEPHFDEDGPFREGEGFGTPATCETMADWIDRVPDYGGRISMVIDGAIVENHFDGALAYIIMCEPEDIQVMCITYHDHDASDEIVRFAGGYTRNAERQIILDPCLVYPAD